MDLDYYYSESELAGVRESLGGRWAEGIIACLDGMQIQANSDSNCGLAHRLAVIGSRKEALASPSIWMAAAYSYLGDREGAIASAEAAVADNPGAYWLELQLGLALADAGEFERARTFLETGWQYSRHTVTAGFLTTDRAMALIAVRGDAGDAAGVAEVVAAISDNVRRYNEAGMTRGSVFSSPDYAAGIAAFLAGDRQQSLAHIAKAAEDGYFIRPNAAYLQDLYDDPGFAPILAAQQARQARERDKFRDVVCNENPYAAVWQPQPGTCP